jgi:putative membrane protein
MNDHTSDTFDPYAITRPDPSLWTYYIIMSALTVFGFPFVLLACWFKYRTLQYRFDDKGIAMSYGMFFKREIYLTYRRIQDIHVTRNIIQRWLGLASVAIQTASGTSGAEMTIEGIKEPEKLRDFLYRQMRGVRDEAADPATQARDASQAAATPARMSEEAASSSSLAGDEALALLQEIRDELRRLRGAPAHGHASAPGRGGASS